MFQKESPQSAVGSAETVIGPSVKVEGDLKGVGSVVIEGELKGTITTDKEVTIGEAAKVDANIHANSAKISGSVTGNVNIAEHLEITSSAKITGDIKTKTIAIESGATINGQLTMGGSSYSSSEPANTNNELS